MSLENIVATVDATFQTNPELDVTLSSSPVVQADLGSIYRVEKNKILCATTEEWNSQPELVAKDGYLYVYTDYKQNEEEQNLAGFKVGDGTSYLIDLPFTDSLLYEKIAEIDQHMRDTSIDASMYHLGFYLDENGGLCQVNSI